MSKSDHEMGGLPTTLLTRLQALINLIKEECDIDALPGVVMPHLIDLFNPDIACYYVKDNDKRDYRQAASFPDTFWQRQEIQETFSRRPVVGGSIGKAIESKKMVVVNNPTEAEAKGEYVPFDPSITSEIAIPILAQRRLSTEEGVVALILLSRRERNEFTQEECQLVNIAGSIVNTIYNNCLAKELKERRIEFLASITESQSLDLDSTFERFLTALSELVPSKFTSLWLYNELDNSLVIRSFYPAQIGEEVISFESLDRRVMKCSECLSGEVVNSKKPKVFTRIDASDKFSNPSFARQFGLEWFVSVPVLDADGKTLGVINLCPVGDPQELDEEANESLVRYISPLANIIRLAYLLFEEDLLIAYDDFFKVMLEFQDQQASWDSLAKMIRDRMKCAGCSIFLAEADGLLYLKGTTGLIGNPPYKAVVYEPSQGLTGTAFKQGDPIIYYSEAKEQYSGTHISKFREHTSGKSKSIILVQILDRAGHPIGVIRCNNKEETPARHVGRFTKEDVLQLQKIAQIVASVHSKTSWIREREKERERSLNSLHHELLSPLEGISQHIEWLEYHLDVWKSPEEWDKDRVLLKLSDMKQNSKLIDVVVTSLGRFDEKIRIKKRDVSLIQLLDTCRAFIYNEAARKGIKIRVDKIYVSRMRGDELQLMRVFYNLLRNAVKYSDPKEQYKLIDIYISAKELDHFVLSFSDNGIGIVKGEEERIFEMYERGSNAAKYFPEGTGLGLAFCRSIMKKHGGQISVDPNSLSKPTTFHLRFPRWR